VNGVADITESKGSLFLATLLPVYIRVEMLPVLRPAVVFVLLRASAEVDAENEAEEELSRYGQVEDYSQGLGLPGSPIQVIELGVECGFNARDIGSPGMLGTIVLVDYRLATTPVAGILLSLLRW